MPRRLTEANRPVSFCRGPNPQSSSADRRSARLWDTTGRGVGSLDSDQISRDGAFERMTEPTTLWWPLRLPAAGSVRRLFCCPYAGGGASVYATWVDRAPREWAIVPVQLPGREHRLREAAIPSLDR